MSLSSLQLDAFVTVAQTRNFSKAAEKLHITQSALSQRILNLEEYLSISLFIRERAGVRLTEAGSELLRYCQVKETLEDEFLETLKTKDLKALSGSIRIAGFSSVMMSVIVPPLGDLLRTHSRIRLEVLTKELRDLPDLLRRGEVDYIVTDQKMDLENVESILLGEERNVLVTSKTHPDIDVYLDHDEYDEITKRYLKLAKQSTAKLQRRYLDDVYGLLEGVRMGIGKAIVPEHLLDSKADFKVVNSSVALMIPVYLVFYKQPYYSRLHSEVVKALEGCKARLKARM